jgi:uncharacterized protein YfaS (alpha-2-macroglobulin family)
MYFGETVRCKETIKDFNGITLLDPSSNKIEIHDPTGVLKATISNASITREGQGIFHGDYALPLAGTVGTWFYVWTATFDGNDRSVEKTEFEVTYSP